MAGFAGAVYDPAWFVAQQIPQDKPLVASESSIVMAHQLGNMYLGMCMVGLALFWTTPEARVVRNYLIALLIADAGHVGFTWYGLGLDRFMDVSGWNAMAWGNLGATLFLAFTRIAYHSGMFGPEEEQLSSMMRAGPTKPDHLCSSLMTMLGMTSGSVPVRHQVHTCGITSTVRVLCLSASRSSGAHGSPNDNDQELAGLCLGHSG